MISLPTPCLEFREIEEMIFGTVKSRLLLAAIELRIFDRLETGCTASEVARDLGTHPGNTRILLRALAACGLVRFDNGQYENSPGARAFLVSKSPFCITQWLQGAAQAFEPVLDRMAGLVKAGPDCLAPGTHMNSEEMCAFFTHAHAQTELAGIARKTAAIITALPEFTGFSTMLDLGGGPGLNSVAVVQAHPSLGAVVFDRESVLAVAGGYIDRFGMAGRIQTRSGNYLEDDLGQGYDLILASDTLYYDGADLDRLLARIHDALTPGGVLVAVHGVLTRERTAPENLVLGMLPDALMARGELPDEGFLAPGLFRAGFRQVHTQKVRMVSSEMELDLAWKQERR